MGFYCAYCLGRTEILILYGKLIAYCSCYKILEIWRLNCCTLIIKFLDYWKIVGLIMWNWVQIRWLNYNWNICKELRIDNYIEWSWARIKLQVIVQRSIAESLRTTLRVCSCCILRRQLNWLNRVYFLNIGIYILCNVLLDKWLAFYYLNSKCVGKLPNIRCACWWIILI